MLRKKTLCIELKMHKKIIYLYVSLFPLLIYFLSRKHSQK
ncbi:hypothetical protein ykris0001_1480 [Yersinia kristensenii ATCC 33638]|nr:hypothetical protein ykris0001_1480 [Yersinia kristensenii ATCC 33638]